MAIYNRKFNNQLKKTYEAVAALKAMALEFPCGVDVQTCLSLKRSCALFLSVVEDLDSDDKLFEDGDSQC